MIIYIYIYIYYNSLQNQTFEAKEKLDEASGCHHPLRDVPKIARVSKDIVWKLDMISHDIGICSNMYQHETTWTNL